MANTLRDTGERLLSDDPATANDSLVFARHLFAYRTAQERLGPARNVLDLGCGMGYGTSLLGEGRGLVVGVEVAADAVALANRRYGRRGTRFALYGGSVLPFRSGAFDAVVSFQAIEHVADDRGFVREIARTTRPEGICVVSTPNAETRLKPGERPWWRFHVREYRSLELAQLLAASFRTVTVFGVVATPEATAMEERRIRTARRLAAIDPLDLRRFVPASIARRLMGYFVGGSADERGRDERTFDPADFSLSDRTDAAIDLLAICKEPIQR
jgi:SAM-dependent methyltransferase